MEIRTAIYLSTEPSIPLRQRPRNRRSASWQWISWHVGCGILPVSGEPDPIKPLAQHLSVFNCWQHRLQRSLPVAGFNRAGGCRACSGLVPAEELSHVHSSICNH